MGFIRNKINSWLGNEVNVIHRPDSRPSLLNRQETARDKALRELKLAHSNGDKDKVLEILDQINSRSQRQEIFEVNQIGVEDRKALRLFRELASNSSASAVSAKAKEIIFAYAHEKAGTLILEPGTRTIHPHATEILTGIEGYLTEESSDKKREALSYLTGALGYHITGLRQAVLADSSPDAKASKNNNLLWQLYNHNGIGSVIYSLLNESDFIEDNKTLMHTRFTQGDAAMDLSINGDLQKANLLHQTKKSVMGIFGSWSSCNFEFRVPRFDSSTGQPAVDAAGNPIYELDYNLDKLLTDVCNEGPGEANNRFIDAYVKLVEYKERLREDPANATAVKRIEKELTKALKFLFDSNKLQATGSEGDLIYQALQENMKSHGSMRFLSTLFKSVMGPNEIAEVSNIRSLYRDAFGVDLTYTENGVTNRVETLRHYKLALEQREEAYTTSINTLATSISSATNLGSPEMFAKLNNDFANLCSNYRDQAQAIESNTSLPETQKTLKREELLINFKTDTAEPYDGISWSEAPLAAGTIETLEGLISYAQGQMPSTYAEYGSPLEIHVKNSGSINAIAAMRNKSQTERSPEENLILRILAEDKATVERHNDGKSMDGHIEALLNRRVAGYPDPNSSIVAVLELIRRIDADSSAETRLKQLAKEKVLKDTLGLSGIVLNNQITQDQANNLYSLSHQITTLSNQEEPIRARAKHKFSAEIVRFIKIAIPEADIDSLDGDLGSLNRIVDNLVAMKSRSEEDPERKKLELANLALIGIDMNAENSYGFDESIYIGSLLDPNQDIGMIELFIETLKSVFEYIKIIGGASPAQKTKQENKRRSEVALDNAA
jgi:hypothetical protein